MLERPLMDVWFKNANTGFAIGAYGTFLRTDDGGKTWQMLEDVLDRPVTSISNLSTRRVSRFFLYFLLVYLSLFFFV